MRHLWFALAMFLCVISKTHAQATAFPLNNPSFESPYATAAECANITGEVATGWNDNTCWYDQRPVIRYARDAVNPHSGSAAQKITLVSGDRVQFAQFLGASVAVGRRYTIALWLRAEAPMFVTAALRQASAPYSVYGSKLIKLSTAWVRYELDSHTQNSDAVLLLIATNPGTFWVDDASMQSEASALANPLPPTSAIPRGFFGMHLNQADTPWPQVGDAIGAVRIWDAGQNRNGSGIGAQWSEINPAAGSYDWRGLDARVAAAAARGADVVYTLGGRTPQWAALNPVADSPYGPGQCSEPRNDQIWQDWVRAIATRYKGKIKFWEVWNEPDLAGFYCGNPDKLVDLARQTYDVVKQVDPTNQVLSPGFSGYDGPGHLDYYLAQGGGRYADIISYHFYVDRPEDVAGARTANIKSVLTRYGVQSKPLWNTEQGWLDIPAATQLPQSTGAAYVARAHILSWAYGLSRFYWYTWDNQWNQFAFTQTDLTTLSVSGVAYREVARWLTGAVMESLSVDVNGTYVVTLRNGAGTQQRILWNATQTVSFAVPSAWGVNQRRDLSAAQSALSGPSISIGPLPVLLEKVGTTSSEVILDNANAGIQDSAGGRTFGGQWCTATAPGFYGSNSLYSCGGGIDSYRWTPNLPTTGRYQVYVWWVNDTANGGSVKVQVIHANGVTGRNFDQRSGGGQWVLHGTYNFIAGKRGFVQLNDVSGRASADAVRWVLVP